MTRAPWSVPRECLLVALLACVVRLLVVVAVEPEPVWDGRYFDAFARHLADGDGYVVASEGDDGLLKPTAHYPVGFPAVLAVAYRWFGDRVGVAFVVQTLFGAGLVVVVHAIASQVSSRRAARLAAVLTAFHPGLVMQAPLIMAEPLAALLYAGIIACMMQRDAGVRRYASAGALAGFATLVRPQTLLLAPALLAVVLAENPANRRSLVPRARGALVFALAFGAVVLPWSLRNARVLDGPALVSTNGGWNLAIGTLPGATGRYRGLPAGHGCEAEVGEVHLDRCLGIKGREAIANDPRRMLALVPAKLSYAMDYEEFPMEAIREARPEAVPDLLRRCSWPVFMAFHQALLLGAAFVVVRHRPWKTQVLAAVVAAVPMLMLARPTSGGVAVALAGLLLTEDDRLSRLVGATLGVFLCTHAVFFGEDRYHIVIEALLVIVLAVRVYPRMADPKVAGP